MAVIIKKSRETAGGFDPTPKLGWLTYLVSRDGKHKSFLVLDYKQGVMRLKGEGGSVFDSKYQAGLTELHYDVILNKDPHYVAPIIKIVKAKSTTSIAHHGQKKNSKT